MFAVYYNNRNRSARWTRTHWGLFGSKAEAREAIELLGAGCLIYEIRKDRKR